MFIIIGAIGVSSNGRTRDFGSLYHGSNPCAPTKNSTGIFAGLIFGFKGAYGYAKAKRMANTRIDN